MKRMKKGAATVWLIILLAVIVGLGYISYGVISNTVKDKDGGLKLGLDLAGGVSITYEATGETPTQEQMDDTITKIQQRIENDLGAESSTTEASVYQVGDDRITVEIPGVSDANALLEELGTPGQLYFIAHYDADGNENYSYSSTTYTYELNYDIDTLIENGSVILTGSNVKSAEAQYEQNQTTGAQSPVVAISLDSEGTEAFAAATETAYNNSQDSIGIYYDGEFISVPSVNAVISGGEAVISGMSDYEAAEQLASYIRIGGLDITLEEIQSEVVGAQLGSDALNSALLAAGIGLLVVMAFMIFDYLLPGVAAAIALALYTVILVGLLYAFNITLTLSGIAGIILSIGMAVDANAIIFARIREEITAGQSVRQAVNTGFSKAMGAIVDGNITTLIAAAVLYLLGSGSVKGFATTLALGVVLSMFTALVITRLLMNIFMAFGLRDVKFYGKSRQYPKFDFIGKRKIFIGISVAVILVGVVFMGVYQVKDSKALNYSLEFSGGTSTTVDFEDSYTLQEAEETLVPVFSEITGDNDIQIQTVQNSNQIIFKTRTLDLDERQALNEALEEQFGVTEESITSQNISSIISGEMRRTSLIAVLVATVCMLLYIWFRFKDIRFATSAIIALIHDVLVVLTLYAIVRISVGSAFIACILTVVGYSVNDTIVIFDRHRDNLKLVEPSSDEELAEIANEGIRKTIGRSISTSITTAVMVLFLLIFGSSAMREFAFPLLVGVLCGTYSSIFIATPLWYLMRVKIKSNKKDDSDNTPKITANADKAARKKKKAEMAKNR